MDLGIVDPEPFILKIGTGENVEEINLPLFPAYMYIKTSQMFKKHPQITEITFEDTMEFLIETLGRENPNITEEFLSTKCTGSQVAAALMVLMNRFLLETLPESTKTGKKSGEKNPNP